MLKTSQESFESFSRIYIERKPGLPQVPVDIEEKPLRLALSRTHIEEKPGLRE